MRKGYFLRLLLWLVANGLFAQQLPFLLVPGGPLGVQVLFQDHLGRLWVGGGADAACFDGSRFYSMQEQGLPPSTIWTITEDEEGAIWIGSETGAYRYYAGHLKEVVRGFVTAIAATSDAIVVSAGPVGQPAPRQPSLFRLRANGNAWNSERITQWSWPIPFTLDHTGRLLLPHSGGWAEVSMKEVAHWRSGARLALAEHTFRTGLGVTYLRDRFGCMWYRSAPLTAYQCPSDPAPIELHAFASTYRHMSEASDGSMIFVNTNSVVTGRPGNLKTVTAAQGLPFIDAAIIATDGTVWLGGPKGLYRWPQPHRLEYWTAKEGFAGNSGICRLGNRMFAGNGQAGIALLSDDRARWLPLPKTKPLGLVYDLAPDRKGGLLAALLSGGVAQIHADGTVVARAGLPSDEFVKLLRDSNGEAWAVGVRICRVRQTGTSLTLEAETLPDPGKTGTIGLDMEFQPDVGKPWACWSGAGLIHKEIDGWRSITTKDELASNYCRSLATLPGGDVWVGYYDSPSFARVRTDSPGEVTVTAFGSRGNERNQVMFLDVDSRGWLWRGTMNGIYVAQPADAERNEWTRLDEADGLPNSSAKQQGFYSDADGSVWWLTGDSSVTHFSPPSDFLHPALPPNIFVAGLSSGREAAKLDGPYKVAGGFTVTAHVGSMQFDRRNALRLRYRVLPQQTAWRESRDLDVPLGVLSWGDHTFEAQARLGTGPWSGTAAHAFKVLRPFWATWPFLICFAAGGIGVGFGGYQLEKRRRRIEGRRLPDLRALRVDAITPEAHALIDTPLNGRFVPMRVLARGGFATVFDGRDEQQNRRCAIKVFHREMADQGLGRRFAQEVAALQTVVHPNVVRIYGQGETPLSVPYLVMEFVEGRTLREAIPPAGLPLPEVASLLRQAGQALAAIHAHGICHRDLKPDNLMIRSAGPADERLVLIDFSIAIVKSPDKTVHGLSRAAGTIQYMAPEQAVGWANESSDIYSLAKVTMEMITGQRLTELLPDASRDLAVRVKEFLRGLPIGLSEESIELLGGALEFDPERRPQDALAFARRIAADLAGSGA